MPKPQEPDNDQPRVGANDVDVVRQLNDGWVEALVKADCSLLDRILADDFIFAYPMDGDSKAQFLEDIESGNLTVEYLNRSRVEVNLFASTAVVTAFDDAKWHYRGHEILGCYKVIEVFSNRDDRWQLVTFQACPVAAK